MNSVHNPQPPPAQLPALVLPLGQPTADTIAAWRICIAHAERAVREMARQVVG